MGAWRVDQRYGAGAANVRLNAEPLEFPSRPYTLFEGIARLRDDLHAEGHSLRRMVAAAPALALGIALVMSFFVTVVRDRIDESAVTVVMMRTEPLSVVEPVVEEVPPPEPEPIPEPKVAEKPPPPAPKPEPMVVPPPPEPKIAKAPPPKPRVEMPKPTALPRPLAPPPVARREPLRARPEPPRAVKPKLEMAALDAPEVPAPTRAERVRPSMRPDVAAPKPRVELQPVAQLAVDEAPAPRAERFAAVRQKPLPRSARPDLAPVIASRAPDAPATPTRPGRSARSAPAVPQGHRPSPDLALPTAMTAPKQPVPAAPARTTRAAPRAAPRPSAPAPSLALPASSATRTAAAMPSRAPTRRGERTAPGPQRSRAAGTPDARLAGVPLGSLAACVSDREEDLLKQKLVAAVTTQKECVSGSGTYRFVETKNLNAFLMRIERAPGRTVADRCVELRYAIDCVRQQRR